MRREYVKLALFVAALVIVLIIQCSSSGCAAPQTPITTDVVVTILEDQTELEVVECEEDVPDNPHPTETALVVTEEAPERWLGLTLPVGWTLGFQSREDSFLVFGPGDCFARVRLNPARDRMIWSLTYDIVTEEGLRHRMPFGYDPVTGPLPEELRVSAVESYPCDDCSVQVTVSVNWPVERSALAELERRLQRLDDLLQPLPEEEGD